MNELIVDVRLWGANVGSLYWDTSSRAAVFEYEDKFIRSGLNISPIVMPLDRSLNHAFNGTKLSRSGAAIQENGV